MGWAVVVHRGWQEIPRGPSLLDGDMGEGGQKPQRRRRWLWWRQRRGRRLEYCPSRAETSQPPFLTTPQHF
jgi:hypothetical protein